MANRDNFPHYRTFLLTLCLEPGNLNSPTVWHFRLADPLSGQRHSFATLEALTTALVQEMVIDEANIVRRKHNKQNRTYL